MLYGYDGYAWICIDMLYGYAWICINILYGCVRICMDMRRYACICNGYADEVYGYVWTCMDMPAYGMAMDMHNYDCMDMHGYA